MLYKNIVERRETAGRIGILYQARAGCGAASGVRLEGSDPIIYYLNRQKQRSTGIDTAAYAAEHGELFKSFIANHETYRGQLERLYNRTFKTNLTAPVKTYPVALDGWHQAAKDGDGRRAHGKTLAPHQWQTIHHLYRQGKGISALGTGFGKTVSAIGLMSLLRQEGKAHRIWLQVPNNKVKDWIAEIKDVMPGLSIAAIDPEEKGYGSRAARYARYHEMANSGADIIIMPESAASEIQLQAEHDREISSNVAQQYADAKAGGSKRAIQQAELSGLAHTANGKTNRAISFEDFGCDALFVDEAHRFKNLFTSNLSRETGMNDGRQSAKAMALFKKSEYIRKQNGGKNVFLFTATPLTNSPLEYYNMLQFVAPEELSRFGISTIDGFINEFADIKDGPKYDWKTSKAIIGKILSGFKNLQTLQNLFFKYTDLQNDPKAVSLEKPDAENRPNIISADTAQMGALKGISEELEKYAHSSKDERESEYPGQNFLTFYAQMRAASLDLELFDPAAYKGWKNPKLEALAKNAKARHDATKGGQVIFCDRVFSGDASFNIHEKIKQALVSQGFKESDIVIVNGFTKSGGVKSDSAVEKEVSKAIDDYNSGAYKVIIGSTACIGEGVNLQKNSSGLHHFDIPFRPSDFIQRNGRIDRQGNGQSNVELHTYMSAGTIDNYSVGLVQGKANWIGQMLKTKSNVFANPDADDAMDVEEMLLALTEEWGDQEQAAARRAEMRRQKEEAIATAHNEQRQAKMALLSMMRGAAQSLKNTESKECKARMEKIRHIEAALKNNPSFTRHDLLETQEPFLYSKDTDTVFRAGDIIVAPQAARIITALNCKKREFAAHLHLSGEAEARQRAARNSGSYAPPERAVFKLADFKPDAGSWSPNRLLGHIEKATTAQKEICGVIAEEAFYAHPDNRAKEQFYPLHIKATATQHGKERPLVFLRQDDGTVKFMQAYTLNDQEEKLLINPYSEAGRQALSAAADAGIEADTSGRAERLEAARRFFPGLFKALEKGIAVADGAREKKAQLASNDFYHLEDSGMKAARYFEHIAARHGRGERALTFSVIADGENSGKLAVNLASAMPDTEAGGLLNPFVKEDKQKMLDALDTGVVFLPFDTLRDEIMRNLDECLPRLHDLIAHDLEGIQIPLENSAENLKQNFLCLAKHPSFEGRPVALINHLAGSAPAEQKAAFAKALMGYGCVDPESTRETLAAWLEEGQGKEEARELLSSRAAAIHPKQAASDWGR